MYFHLSHAELFAIELGPCFLQLCDIHSSPVRGHGHRDGLVAAVLFQYVQRDEV